MQGVFQLAHIAGQWQGLQTFHKSRGHGRHGGAVVGGDFAQQRLCQSRYVFAPLAQRRHIDADDIEPVIQVLPELARLHHLCQVFVRGADDAHIYGDFFRSAQGAHLPLLNHAQQLGLHGKRQVANFVQKQRAARCALEQAFAVGYRPGISAFAGTEKFGFEQRFGNGAAIDGHKRPIGTVAALVQGARHQLLARARFPPDQHGGHAGCHFTQGGFELLHGRASTDHAGQRGWLLPCGWHSGCMGSSRRGICNGGLLFGCASFCSKGCLRGRRFNIF